MWLPFPASTQGGTSCAMLLTRCTRDTRHIALSFLSHAMSFTPIGANSANISSTSIRCSLVTPFSTVTFERKLGSEGARRMLAEGEKLSSAEAVRLGFVDVLVEDGGPEDLVRRACEFAEQWVAEGRGRLIVEQDLIETLDATNQREGQQLADAMFSPAFWRANGVPGWLARPLSPVLRQLAKL